MVKGITRQIVLVKPQQPALFEQAIFLLRDDVLRAGVSEEDILREARQAAMHGSAETMLGWRQKLTYALCGAMPITLAWVLSAII